MSYQEKEVFKLNKQLLIKQEQFKRERSILLQKIQLLTSQISDYQQKQMKNRQLNQSIIMSYRQNESFREQYNQKQLESKISKHQEEMKRLKNKSHQERKKYEQEILQLKAQNERLRIDAQKNQFQFQKKLSQIKFQCEEKISQKESDMNVIFNHQIQMLRQKNRQSEEFAKMYKQQLQMRLNKSYQAQQPNTQRQNQKDQYQNQLNIALKKNREGYNVVKHNQQTLSLLNLRINRALVQLNPNKSKLQERIKDIKMKKF